MPDRSRTGAIGGQRWRQLRQRFGRDHQRPLKSRGHLAETIAINRFGARNGHSALGLLAQTIAGSSDPSARSCLPRPRPASVQPSATSIWSLAPNETVSGNFGTLLFLRPQPLQRDTATAGYRRLNMTVPDGLCDRQHPPDQASAPLNHVADMLKYFDAGRIMARRFRSCALIGLG